MKVVFSLLRVKEWVKNLFIFLPTFFSFQLHLFYTDMNLYLIFMYMSFAASSIYIYNDYRDVEKDRNHHTKKHRPIAAGKVSPSLALGISLILSVIAIAGAFSINAVAGWLIVLYIVQNILYSYKLKDIAIVDITIISIGFLIRIFLGGAVTGIVISKWLVLMVFLMSLVLALGKRRDDLLLMESGGGSGSLRNSLSGYNVEFINNSIILLSVITLMSYLLYTVSPDVISRVHSDLLYLTVIPVLVGFLRYLQLVLVFKSSGSPTQILLKDLFIQITVVAWIAIYCIIVYIFK